MDFDEVSGPDSLLLGTRGAIGAGSGAEAVAVSRELGFPDPDYWTRSRLFRCQGVFGVGLGLGFSAPDGPRTLPGRRGIQSKRVVREDNASWSDDLYESALELYFCAMAPDSTQG